MKSYAPMMAGSAGILTAIAVASVLITPTKLWQVAVLTQAKQFLAGTEFGRYSLAPMLVVSLAVGLLAAIVTLLIFAKLEIIAAGWAAEKSAQALRGKPGELTVEEEMRKLVRKFGRR